jgi:membrane protein YqaA with SNARE-associated domain
MFAPAATRPHRTALFRLFLSLGLFGLFAVAAVDSSFIPLPIPGISDLMIVLMAARHTSNWLVIVLVASLGSALGGYISYRVGERGGMAFIEKRVPPRIFHLVRDWMERHSILSVALPALLPPPMPLSPFVLAAGALKMSQRTFMTAFCVSRTLRHAIAAWLGLHYGRHILRMWNRIFSEYGTQALIAIWVVIGLSCGFAVWRIYKTSQSVAAPQSLEPQEKSA